MTDKIKCVGLDRNRKNKNHADKNVSHHYKPVICLKHHMPQIPANYVYITPLTADNDKLKYYRNDFDFASNAHFKVESFAEEFCWRQVEAEEECFIPVWRVSGMLDARLSRLFATSDATNWTDVGAGQLSAFHYLHPQLCTTSINNNNNNNNNTKIMFMVLSS